MPPDQPTSPKPPIAIRIPDSFQGLDSLVRTVEKVVEKSCATNVPVRDAPASDTIPSP